MELLTDVMFWLGVVLGYSISRLQTLIHKAVTEKVWDCPHCSMVIRSNSEQFLMEMKTDHIRTHLQ